MTGNMTVMPVSVKRIEGGEGGEEKEEIMRKKNEMKEAKMTCEGE